MIAKYLNLLLQGLVSRLAEKTAWIAGIARRAGLAGYSGLNGAAGRRSQGFAGLPRPSGTPGQWGNCGTDICLLAAIAFNEWGRDIRTQFDEATILKFLKEPEDLARSPQSRLRLFHRRRISNAPDVAGTGRYSDPFSSNMTDHRKSYFSFLPWCRDGNYGCLLTARRVI